MKKLILLLLSLLFLIPLTQACLDVKIAKSSYLSGETFQAEITGSLIKPLTYNDFSFSNSGKTYFPPVTLQQIASNKWIVFGDISEKYGLNDFSVSKVICRENATLREESVKSIFIIKRPLQDYFSALIDRVKGKWFSLPINEASQSILALSEFPESENGRNFISGECFPITNCTIKSTALAALASNLTDDKKEWLMDSQNSVDAGLWKLITESDSVKDCRITINGKTWNLSIQAGTNELPLSLPDDDLINISLDCSVSAKIFHTYMGEVHEFPVGEINNKKCWGKTYRSACDALSTAYALQIISDSKAEQWLSDNAKTTEEIAYAYIYTQKSDFNSWLVNNQHSSGYWSNTSLAISTKPDVYSTVAAIRALGGNAKAEQWLKDNLDSFSYEEKALALQLFKDKIEPLISIQNGFVKTNSMQNLTLKISNKGIIATEIKMSLLNAEQSILIPAKSTIPVSIQVPSVSQAQITTIDIISTLKSEERVYSIPVLVIPAGKTEADVNLIEQNITEDTLKAANFQFLENKINETLGLGEMRTITLNINNSGAEKITADVTLFGLSGIIDSIPVSVELAPNAITQIPVIFKATSMDEYSGMINIEYQGNYAKIPVYISVKEAVVSEKSCSELKGKICLTGCKGNITKTKEGDCCSGECSNQPVSAGISTKTIGIILVVLAVIIGAGFILLKSRKPKKRSLEKVLEKIKEESRVQDIESAEKKI
jgi:hypothetical protein